MVEPATVECRQCHGTGVVMISHRVYRTRFVTCSCPAGRQLGLERERKCYHPRIP